MRLGPLTEADADEALPLLAAEGWTFTARELGLRIAAGQGLGVAAREGGALLGLLTVARHGALAWVGNVVVAPAARGRGLGAALVRDALARARGAGVGAVKLCSVPKARTLYDREGFRAEGGARTLGAWHERPAHRPRDAELVLEEDLPALAAFDARAFGADRAALLGILRRAYPDTGALVRAPDGSIAGYAWLQPGAEGSVLGPLVTRPASRATAALLLDAVLGFRLQGGAVGVECTIPAAHPWMEALLAERGFRFKHATTLMAHGAPLAQDWAACAALGGLEKG